MKRLLLIPDTHRPYHDEAAWQLMLKAARTFKPHAVIVLGDFADCYSISQHDKNPTRGETFEDEVSDVNKGLDEIEASTPIAERYFVAGNHEHRLERFLQTNAPPLFSMLTIPKLLRLKDRGWHYTPYQRALKIGKLHITHDEGTAGPQAHERARSSFEGNVVIGHTHRMALSYRGNAKGRSHVGAMFGWLGNIDRIDYMHRVRAQQWQLGFGVGYMQTNGTVHLQAVPIIDGACVVAGKLIR
jgi:predicted phosphodiesterase